LSEPYEVTVNHRISALEKAVEELNDRITELEPKKSEVKNLKND
jgi:hypothetical protein